TCALPIFYLYELLTKKILKRISTVRIIRSYKTSNFIHFKHIVTSIYFFHVSNSFSRRLTLSSNFLEGADTLGILILRIISAIIFIPIYQTPIKIINYILLTPL